MPFTMRAVQVWCLLVACFCLSQTAYGFDKPRKIVRANLGQINGLAGHADCYYYSTFMIKEVRLGPLFNPIRRPSDNNFYETALTDSGMKGGDDVSVVPIAAKGPRPACQKDALPSEWTLPLPDGGYFMGARGRYIFADMYIDASGGEFTVCDAEKGRCFYQDRYQIPGRLGPVRLDKGALVFRFQRAAVGQCSVDRDGSACWEGIGEALSLPSKNLPKTARSAYSRHARLEIARRNCRYLPKKLLAKRGGTVASCVKKEMAAVKPTMLERQAPTEVGYAVKARWDGKAMALTPLDQPIVDWWPVSPY